MNLRIIYKFILMKKLLFVVVCIGIKLSMSGQVLGVFKYDGGGDWYANPTALDNLAAFYNENLEGICIVQEEVSTSNLLQSGISFLHATGHGRIFFDELDVQNLRYFIERGGFLHIDDNYGMGEFARTEMQKIFPDQKGQLLPKNHFIFRGPFEFPQGLPKIHEHDGKAPQAIGYFLDDELVAVLTLECDLGDGWEDAEVHNDDQATREKALKMGSNLLHWALTRNTEP